MSANIGTYLVLLPLKIVKRMSVVSSIKTATAKAIDQLYNVNIKTENILVNDTKPEFTGEYTVVLFAFVKQLKKSPEVLGDELGNYLLENHPELVISFNVIKGFLNLEITPAYWLQFLHNEYGNTGFGKQPDTGKTIMVEYSSPNTNKPIHLGHLRNNFLGWSIAEILKAQGNNVVKTCIVNDRGIHICKSMLAWQKHANGATPESAGMKGDHLVGHYYVMFEQDLKAQAAVEIEKIKERLIEGYSETDMAKTVALLDTLEKHVENGNTEKHAEVMADIMEIARNHTPIMQEAKQMLKKWEDGDTEVIGLWKTMNSWVYKGFEETYKTIGSDFHKTYYESETYLLGKEFIETGLEKNVFFKKDDGSVWVDLTADGLDEKLVLRKDGTSVYITQDIGLAHDKHQEFNAEKSIYVIGDEQNYHMKVLKLILQKLGESYADGIFHLSYGMVELPSGKMKSREGTVVDADEIVSEMTDISKQKTEELGKVKDFNESELIGLYHTLAMGALKFFLLRVDPKKRMVFNPEESIDFHGFTGPFVQYTHARIKSVLRKAQPHDGNITGSLFPLEKELLVLLERFPSIISDAADNLDPSKIAIYVFSVAKMYNSFYSEHSVLSAESEEKKQLRLQLSQLTAQVIKTAMQLLGIAVPERM